MFSLKNFPTANELIPKKSKYKHRCFFEQKNFHFVTQKCKDIEQIYKGTILRPANGHPMTSITVPRA